MQYHFCCSVSIETLETAVSQITSWYLMAGNETYRKLLWPLLRCYSHHLEEMRGTKGISNGISNFTIKTRPQLKVPRTSRQSALEGDKVVTLTHRPPLTPQDIPGAHSCYTLSLLPDHSADWRIKSMKNSGDTNRNRTRDLPTCSSVPQWTAPPRTPSIQNICVFLKTNHDTNSPFH